MIKIIILTLILFCFSGCDSKEDLVVLNTDDNISIEMNGEDESSNSFEDKKESTVNMPERVTVYICGAVNNPGVYSLNSGDRINDAILLSGGAKEDAALEYMNLADYVRDGEKIYVINKEEVKTLKEDDNGKLNEDLADSFNIKASDSSVKADENTSNSNLVNLNTASKEQLMGVPGIGESKAVKIIAFRENQKFSSIEDIMLISGIKEGLFNKIKDYICV